MYERRKKYKFKLDLKLPSVVITSSNDFVSFITDHFHSRALYRLFICDPELYKITSPLPHIYYHFCWVICSDPHHLLNLQKTEKSNNKTNYLFLNNIIPDNIDYTIYNALHICKDLRIQETLRYTYNLPEFRLVKHSIREELYTILRQHLDDDIYNALDKGNYPLVLQTLNSTSNYNNIWDYINDKIDTEIQELKTHLTKIKMNNSDVNLEIVTNIQDKIEKVNCKRTKLYKTIHDFKKNNNCAICENAYGEDASILFCCNNLICSTCVFKWMHANKKCPYCISTLFNDSIHSLSFPFKQEPTNIIESEPINLYKKLKTRQQTIFDLIIRYIPDSNIMFYSESNTIMDTMITFCEENGIEFIDFSSNLSYKEKQIIVKNITTEKKRLFVINSYNDLIGFSFLNIDHFISYSFISKWCYKFICSRFYRVGRSESKPFHFHTFFSY